MFSLTFLAFLSSSVAHNWVNSPSRSEFANTVNPALPSPTGLPHVKVIAGQKFQIEWVVGHDADAYFTLTTAENHMRNLAKQTKNVLEDYLDGAPGAQKTIPPPQWQKYHRKYNSPNLDNKAGDNFFLKHLKQGDADFIPRPEAFEGRFSGKPSRNVDLSLFHTFMYKQSGACIDTDRRVEYKNPNFPWIISMHKYRFCADQPSRPDVAWFAFPKGTPPGMYVVQYNWRGYYDVIDVEIVAGNTPTKVPYGDVPPVPPLGTPAHYRRVDHCVFPQAVPTSPCIKIRSDARACLDGCDRGTELQCQGVNVVPLVNPDTVYPAFKDRLFIPSEFPSQCPTSISRNAKVGDRMCYALKARPSSDTIRQYFVTDDPDDPAFYSTCYIRIPFKVAPSGGTLASPPRPLDWSFRGKCIGCKDATLAQLEYAQPSFDLAKTCANCDLDGVALKDIPNGQRPVDWQNTKPKWTKVMDGICRGHGGIDREPTATCTANPSGGCRITLRGPGAGNQPVSLHDCQQLAKANGACSDMVYTRKVGDENIAQCFCWRKNVGDYACCGTCTAQSSGSFELYKLD